MQNEPDEPDELLDSESESDSEYDDETIPEEGTSISFQPHLNHFAREIFDFRMQKGYVMKFKVIQGLENQLSIRVILKEGKNPLRFLKKKVVSS